MLSPNGASKSPSFSSPSKAVLGGDFRVGPSSLFSVPSSLSLCPLCSSLRALSVKSFLSLSFLFFSPTLCVLCDSVAIPLPPYHHKLMPASFSVRLATQADIPTLHALIESSVRILQANDYTPAQIEGALDTQLLADQTYFVAETTASSGAKIIVACGGWSKRKTLFGSDHAALREPEFLDPATDAAKIRAIFVHPDWARRGLGTLLLETCENAAKSAGFTKFEMGSTLTGVPLYKLRGYHVIEPIAVPLHNGESLPIIRMAKSAT